MLLYFQEAFEDFYKHTSIKQICSVRVGYVMCQKSIYNINLFFFFKPREEIQLAAIELKSSKIFFFLSFYSIQCSFLFPIFKDYTK